MTVTEQIVTIFIVALVTQLTRWIPSYGTPEILSGICVVVIQMLFKNMACSILLGTGLYILLIN